MNLPLKNLITDKLYEYNNKSVKVIRFLKENDYWKDIFPVYNTDGETLYNYLFENSKTCSQNKIKFVSFSVGYTFCGPASTCECAKKQISNLVKKTKLNFSEEKKKAIANKRKNTNLKKYGIENVFSNKEKIKQSYLDKLGVENPRHLKEVNQKIKETNLSKYGVDNPSKNIKIKEQQKQSWIKNKDKHIKTLQESMIKIYGVKNPRHLKEVNQKTKETNLSKYGVDNPSKNSNVISKIKTVKFKNFYENIDTRVNNTVLPLFEKNEYLGTKDYYNWRCNTCDHEFIDRVINGRIPVCRKCNPYNISLFETEIKNYLLSVLDESKLIFNDRTIIKPYELDIVIPEKNIAIECNGIYRHSELNGKSKTYHLTKTKMCEDSNYRLIHITDSCWYTKNEIVKSIINSAIGISLTEYARNCKIVTIDYNTKKEFLEKNHLQGDAASSINLALEQNGKISAVMTFGKSRYNKKVEWELIRYCQILNTTIVGGPSKLFKHFVKTFKPQSVISYADRSIFNGNMYTKLGFSFIHYSKPGYYYFSKNKFVGLENRTKYQKHKLSNILTNYDNSLTEWENMYNHNYDRYWDCGNAVWKWKR